MFQKAMIASTFALISLPGAYHASTNHAFGDEHHYPDEECAVNTSIDASGEPQTNLSIVSKYSGITEAFSFSSDNKDPTIHTHQNDFHVTITGDECTLKTDRTFTRGYREDTVHLNRVDLNVAPVST